MTYPAVDDLPEEATSTLLDVCTQLSRSRHAGLARWAASVSDALLVRLVTVTTGVHVGGTTSNPSFMPDVKGMVGNQLKGLVGGKNNPVGNLGGLFGKKKPN